MIVPIEHYLILSALLFAIGAGGVIISRNLIIIFMSIELMLNAANLSIIAFSLMHNIMDGHVFVFRIRHATIDFQIIHFTRIEGKI